MSRQRFSEMLGNRRRELGLSIEQASRILKLREDVLVAFEEGDFESMPQSGYAQGMLSSYARYLGLDPRRVTDYFQEELFEYVNGSSSHELRRHTRDVQAGRGIRGYELPNEVNSRPKAYVEYHGLLPTAGGPAGDMGAFATTTPAHPRRSVAPAGYGPSAVDAYESQAYGASRRSDEQLGRHPYNSSQRDALYGERADRAERQRRRNSQQRRRYDSSDPSRRLLSSGQQRPYGDEYLDDRGGRYMRDEVNRRGIQPREYVDDMRYDDATSPYERASTISGRRSSRNIASVERPNVRRRSGGGSQPAPGRGGRPSRKRGGRGGGLFSDPQRSLFLLVIVLAAALVAILLFTVNSCVSGRTPSSPKSVSVSSAEDSSSTGTTSATSMSTGSASSGSASTTSSGSSSTSGAGTNSSTDASSTYVPTVVKVSVSSGSYTWLEVTNDGVSDVAESVTGPWEKEYTVTESLSVQAGDPSVVTVTNNGQAVSFTSKASGLGSLTVKGTKPPENTDSAASDGEAAEESAGGETAGSQSTSAASSAAGSAQ